MSFNDYLIDREPGERGSTQKFNQRFNQRFEPRTKPETKPETEKQRNLERDILELTSSIAEESYQNHQRLADQGEAINLWNKDENKMNFKLKKSAQYLRKIGSYAHRVSKFFSKDYYYPPTLAPDDEKEKEVDHLITMKEIDFDLIDDLEDPDNPNLENLLSLNLVDDPTYEFEQNLKKKLEIIKSIQLTIADQLDNQIEELKNHDDEFSRLNSQVQHLDREILRHLD